ncbi:hypothetical protein FZ934_26865 (plasmid) [Rhizobium grahamii]|uniref:Uncharacterized protein n=1 Tax=Rhizobium grahamii TaxID=1120045 RepID=A0A5Q0CDF9_9HYPH|nr:MULTISPECIES: hypothetical protein [Rhizobium]QFY63836.1 hypothetical protein FZ934_26865 [Rhizobium grahamii]QRM52920.1 hypothetical protein F3Y33_27445 [Rhizobium sp. BG6]
MLRTKMLAMTVSISFSLATTPGLAHNLASPDQNRSASRTLFLNALELPALHAFISPPVLRG